MDPLRTVHCEDALAWLQAHGVLAGCSLVTSLPDYSEFPSLTLNQWQDWFVEAAASVLASTPADGVTVFYQSDIHRDGVWVDKGYLCQKAAEGAAHSLLWHKVVARVPPGSSSGTRPGYSHLLCFSQGLRHAGHRSSPDVLPSAGPSSWARGMGLDVCHLICRYLRRHTPSHTLVAPFCGHGLVLAVANSVGLHAVGIERSPKRARRALQAALL
ncbi:SAM-dependent methyltransferase [bacterium]|nr:SAM-dependent methyltransferase [bacterium]